MEIKNAQVTRLVKSATADNYGKWSFHLEFSNGDKGYYNTKNGDQLYFVHGAPADYLIEAKTSKTGSTYYVITHPEEKAASVASVGGFKKPDPKVQIVGFAMAYTKDLIVSGKLELKDLESGFNRIHSIMASKL